MGKISFLNRLENERELDEMVDFLQYGVYAGYLQNNSNKKINYCCYC